MKWIEIITKIFIFVFYEKKAFIQCREMGKLLKSVLFSLLVPAVVGNQSYEVYSCNNEATGVSTDREKYFIMK